VESFELESESSPLPLRFFLGAFSPWRCPHESEPSLSSAAPRATSLPPPPSSPSSSPSAAPSRPRERRRPVTLLLQGASWCGAQRLRPAPASTLQQTSCCGREPNGAVPARLRLRRWPALPRQRRRLPLPAPCSCSSQLLSLLSTEAGRRKVGAQGEGGAAACGSAQHAHFREFLRSVRHDGSRGMVSSISFNCSSPWVAIWGMPDAVGESCWSNTARACEREQL